MKNLINSISQSVGEKKVDLVLKGGQIFNVVTGELLTGDVAISGETIVGTYDEYDGQENGR